jgi:hypothetical protein
VVAIGWINSGQTAPSGMTGSAAFDPCRKWSVQRSRGNNDDQYATGDAASIAVGQEHSRTDPLADTATRAARPLGAVLIP